MSSDDKSTAMVDPMSLVVNPATVHDDPSLPISWHLGSTTGAKKGINVLDVWDEFRGAGILVGVIDDGVEYTHPELAAHYGYALDFDTRDNDTDAYPTSSGDRHGTAVAGVIGAALDNAAGGAGVAPDATIVGYRIGFGANGTIGQLEAAFDRAGTLDVVNNSWGFGGFLGDDFASAEFVPVAAHLHDAIDTGRGGLGTVVVFAAGNGRAQGQDVNYHNFQNDRGIISVAATDSAGNVASFSTPGDAILVSAPGSGVFTTDRVGVLGFSSGDYASVSGTSFSSPIVSGIVALMLDANPGLGWRDVQEILASTAVQTGSAASWSFNHAGNWNGGAMHVSRDFGFGLVDAMAAVRVAESWRQVSASTNEALVSASSSPFMAIADLSTVQSVLVLQDGVRIDRVEVDLVIAHANIGDLRVVLTSPTGTQSVLFNNAPTTQDNIAFTFSSTHDWGELSGGAWTLAVSDTRAGTTGTLQAWGIRAYGDAAGDDTYLYTDEFSTFAVASSPRLNVSDSGGIDVINTAAIASATTLDLRGGSTSVIDGKSVTILLGTLIENADTGDGSDTITGNAAANWLRSWRGSDLLNGGAGADTLEGGAGDDTYIIDASDIVIEGTAGGIDTVKSSISYILGANLEKLVLLNASAINGSGNALDNTITGNNATNHLFGFDGNDALNGGGGADVMDGAAGDDTYTVNLAGDVVVEAVDGGLDTVTSSMTYTLGVNVEKLVLLGVSAINGTGNAFDNVLTGNSAANTLDGATGADAMSGGSGNDKYFVDNAGDALAEAASGGTDTVMSAITYVLGSELENLTLIGDGAIHASGNELDNVLSGNAQANELSGFGGNDRLNGGAGADYLDGGAGNDTYDVDAADVVIEALDGGTDTVRSATSYILAENFEMLVLTGSISSSGTGNALDNTLTGNSWANTLNGGLGADRMIGGGGYDTYIVDHIGDVVVEASGGGTETVRSTVTYTLATNVEKLVLTGAGVINGTGNTLNNELTGNAAANQLVGLDGNDTLNGGAGADVMEGGPGNDTYFVDSAADVVMETTGGGTDTVNSSITHTLANEVEKLTLTATRVINGIGNALDNTIVGNSAANLLDGALGVDDLFGGAGSDIFRFLAGEAAGDTVRDFFGNGASAGDSLRLVGFGADAVLAQVDTSDDWLISYDGGVGNELLHLVGVTMLHPSDYAFV